MTREDVIEKSKARDERETALIALRDKIKRLESQRDRTQTKINTLVKGFVFDGEAKGEDKIIELKKELSAVEGLIATLRGDGIAQAEQNLREANKALVDATQTYIGELRAQKLSEARALLEPIIGIGLQWFIDVDELIKGLGVQLPSFLVEDARKFFVFRDIAPDQPAHVRELWGLEAKR